MEMKEFHVMMCKTCKNISVPPFCQKVFPQFVFVSCKQWLFPKASPAEVCAVLAVQTLVGGVKFIFKISEAENPKPSKAIYEKY